MTECPQRSSLLANKSAVYIIHGPPPASPGKFTASSVFLPHRVCCSLLLCDTREGARVKLYAPIGRNLPPRRKTLDGGSRKRATRRAEPSTAALRRQRASINKLIKCFAAVALFIYFFAPPAAPPATPDVPERRRPNSQLSIVLVGLLRGGSASYRWLICGFLFLFLM